MVESFIYLIPHIFISYLLMYFVIPKYLLRQKYWHTAFWTITIFIAGGFISAFLSLTVIEMVRNSIMGPGHYSPIRRGTTLNVFLALMAGLRGGVGAAGIAATIKLMKFWYVKEQRNLQLHRENIASQLQLLKAQVHPHFLFNTLNNIYSYTQKVSPTASSLVMGLSDMLRYILHEGSRQSVPLSKELKMINDYILLEQIRYGERLEIDKELPDDTKGLSIAPLLLLPFVENSFKHGTSHMLEQAWIRLSIHLDNNKLKMTLINARQADDKVTHEPSGIGIANARKRLELLYPGKHELLITEDEDVFIVNLRIELEASLVAEPDSLPVELHHA